MHRCPRYCSTGQDSCRRIGQGNCRRTLASRLFKTQVTEVHVRIAAMNIMTALGMPMSARIGTVAP